MAKRIDNARKKSKVQENTASQVEKDTAIYESAEVLRQEIDKTQEFVDSNKGLITKLIGGLVLVGVLFFAYKYYMGGQEEEAQGELSFAIFYYEKDSLNKALNGDANNTIGLLAIADKFGSTNAGNLANFYAGVSYLKQGKYDEAIKYASEFSSSDYLLQARSYAIVGDAYMEKKDYSNAVSYYKKASNYKPNKEFTPDYLIKLALAQELGGDKGAAKETYEMLLEEYPLYRSADEVKKELARLG